MVGKKVLDYLSWINECIIPEKKIVQELIKLYGIKEKDAKASISDFIKK